MTFKNGFDKNRNSFTKQQMSKGGKNSHNKRRNDVENLEWDILIEKYHYKIIRWDGLLKERILKEQNYTCKRCNHNTWLQNQIPLEIHHKDGNKRNIKRDNLEAICPNCHYFTDNYKFKGRKHKGA